MKIIKDFSNVPKTTFAELKGGEVFMPKIDDSKLYMKLASECQIVGSERTYNCISLADGDFWSASDDFTVYLPTNPRVLFELGVVHESRKIRKLQS